MREAWGIRSTKTFQAVFNEFQLKVAAGIR